MPRRCHPSLLSAALLAVTFAGCSGEPGPQRVANAVAHERLDAAVARGGRIDLTKVMDREWDRVVLVAPYTPREGIDAMLGFSWEAGRALPRSQDDQNLLLFVRDRAVVGFIEDFRAADPFNGCLPRELPASQATVEVHA